MSTVYHTLPYHHSEDTAPGMKPGAATGAATGAVLVLAPYSAQNTQTYWDGLLIIDSVWPHLALLRCPHEIYRSQQYHQIIDQVGACPTLTHVCIIADARGTVGAGIRALLRELAVLPVTVCAVMPNGVIYMHIQLDRTSPHDGQARYKIVPAVASDAVVGALVQGVV